MNDEPIQVVAADLMRGDLLIYFSDGTTTLFHGPFLYAVRHDDGNMAVAENLPLEESAGESEEEKEPSE